MDANRRDPSEKLYFFVDIDLYSRQIVAVDCNTQDKIEFGELKNGCHRVFLSQGQYNKLVKKLENARL